MASIPPKLSLSGQADVYFQKIVMDVRTVARLDSDLVPNQV